MIPVSCTTYVILNINCTSIKKQKLKRKEKKQVRKAYKIRIALGKMHGKNNLRGIVRLKLTGDFPGGSVAETPCYQCRRLRFNLWSGN